MEKKIEKWRIRSRKSRPSFPISYHPLRFHFIIFIPDEREKKRETKATQDENREEKRRKRIRGKDKKEAEAPDGIEAAAGRAPPGRPPLIASNGRQLKSRPVVDDDYQ